MRERGRVREREDVKIGSDQQRLRWEIRGKSSQVRLDRDHLRGYPQTASRRFPSTSRRPQDDTRRLNLNGSNHGAWGREEAVKSQEGVSRRFWSDKEEKKSFRDLFSKKDIEEGGKWTEVRRRKVIRPPRDRSPIIRSPCFRCGLGGHIRRNCPRKLNMRCYGCGSATHLLRNCTAILRPEEAVVELKSVSNITDRVQHLRKYAIFRARGLVNIHSLKTAMVEKFKEAQWQDRIFPIGRNSFLVGFPQEHWRDWAVLLGRMDFGEFSGTFYAWDENWGAIQIHRPVIVWITLRGLPLHLWGKEEIKTMLAPFGKLHKLDDNFYTKERADYVKAMVEVEDISLVPKTVKCSYKALTDERVRIYSVSLIPSSTCLPVSQWNDETYKSYAEDGGSGGFVEQNWSRREEVPRRAPRRQAERGGDDDEEGEADSAQAQRWAPQNQALNADAGERQQARNAGGETAAEFRDPGDAMADLLEEERERRARVNRAPDLVAEELARRRKGKEIQIQMHSPVGSAEIAGWVEACGPGLHNVGTSGEGKVGPYMGGGLVNQQKPHVGTSVRGEVHGPTVGPEVEASVLPPVGPPVGPPVVPIIGTVVGPRAEESGDGNNGQAGHGSLEGAKAQCSSGSGSCDPGMDREQVQEGVNSSDDADSRIGSGPIEGTVQQNPIIISGGTEEEDMGLGGEASNKNGGEDQKMPKEENVPTVGGEFQLGKRKGKERLAADEGTGVGYVGGQVQDGGSRGSSVSVPPGYHGLKGTRGKGTHGGSSPFGKLQRGGFKFLKRSASSTSSGTKAGKTPAKKTRPISALPDNVIADVASNVGIGGLLSEQQIARLKEREKDRASS